MTSDPRPPAAEGPPRAAYGHLFRQQERVIRILGEVRNELDSPSTRSLLKEVRHGPEKEVAEEVREVLNKIQEVLRAAEVCRSELHRKLMQEADEEAAAGPPELPEGLQRLLVERQSSPGFSYEVERDPLRGWTVRWKEHNEDGTLRGAGKLYEHPHAWLED